MQVKCATTKERKPRQASEANMDTRHRLERPWWTSGCWYEPTWHYVCTGAEAGLSMSPCVLAAGTLNLCKLICSPDGSDEVYPSIIQLYIYLKESSDIHLSVCLSVYLMYIFTAYCHKNKWHYFMDFFCCLMFVTGWNYS